MCNKDWEIVSVDIVKARPAKLSRCSRWLTTKSVGLEHREFLRVESEVIRGGDSGNYSWRSRRVGSMLN